MLEELFADRWFRAALAAGPVAWLLLYLLLRPHPSWQGLVDNTGLLIMACVIYPVLEELAFRGVLQGWLVRQPVAGRFFFAGITGANLLTSALFSAAHLFYHPPLWAVLVFGPSLIFGWFRDRYQSIIPGLVLHIFYNSGYFVLFWTGVAGVTDMPAAR